MADVHDGPDQETLGVAARHALHDEELIAALAAGGLDVRAEAERARTLLERCSACRDLHDDIAAIGASLKLASTFAVAAPRDFRLTAEDAQRLGRPASARGLLAQARRAMAGLRPLGASMAALGIVGLLVGSLGIGGAMPGGATLGPSTTGASDARAGLEAAPSFGTTGLAQPTAPGDDAGPLRSTAEDLATADSLSAAVVAGSAALLVGGFALIVIGTRGRRDPG